MASEDQSRRAQGPQDGDRFTRAAGQSPRFPVLTPRQRAHAGEHSVCEKLLSGTKGLHFFPLHQKSQSYLPFGTFSLDAPSREAYDILCSRYAERVPRCVGALE